MTTTTLRGIFPDPKPIHRKNFVRENIKQLKDMQGYLLKEPKISAQQSLEAKPNKFKNVAPKVYSNISTRKASKEGVARRPYTQNIRNFRSIFNRPIHKGVQTDRPEEITKLYETGLFRPLSKSKTKEEGDNPPAAKASTSKPSKPQDKTESLTKSFQSMNIDEKQDYIKRNISNIKSKVKAEEATDPNLAPPSYHKGEVPKYLKERKQEAQTNKEIPPVEFIETESFSGLVLLPDDERKEYLRVARENYASLIKELNAMPVSNDTLKKRKRKIEIEDELKRLDEVVKIFQKPKVFVKADA